MKHEATTLNTKKNLAAALKKFMTNKPLSKITVSDIISECGFNRKTFYYHFEDIYALLKWVLEQEAIEVVKQFDLLVNTEEAILFVMDYVDANKHILNCAYDSMGREEMKRFFYADFIGIMRSAIEAAETKLDLKVGEEFRDFLAVFYTEALAGMLIDWFRGKSAHSREDTVKNILLILQASIPNTLLAKVQGTGATFANNTYLF